MVNVMPTPSSSYNDVHLHLRYLNKCIACRAGLLSGNNCVFTYLIDDLYPNLRAHITCIVNCTVESLDTFHSEISIYCTILEDS